MERLRYDETHWSREADDEKALEQYLELANRAYNRTKFDLIRKMTGDVTGKKILDYGGGAGIMAVPYARDGAEVLIVDAEANALRTARLYARKEGVLDRMSFIHSETFPRDLKGSGFDLIMAKDIIEHIEDDSAFIKDISECQGRGGRLVLSTQNDLSLNYLIEGGFEKLIKRNGKWCGWDPTHLRFYNYRVFKRLLSEAGYRPLKWASVFIIPYNILSWIFLRRVSIEISSLSLFDRLLGSVYPFNRLGWNIMVLAEKVN